MRKNLKMKKSTILGFVVMLVTIAFSSCKKDVVPLNTNVSPVSTITAPADQESFNLKTGGPSVVFQWNAVQNPDLVLYEVVFDKPNGDFSKPIYSVLSDGSGVKPQATITEKLLNAIASLGGITSSGTGTLKWAVVVSKAANAKLSTVSHTIQFTRPAGFTVLPTALYLTGSATEQGTDITKAIPFKKIAVSPQDTVFELYTSLQPGTYSFIDKTSGTPTVYSIANDTTVVLNGNTTVTSAKKVYRIRLDLSNASATVTQVVSVGFFSAPNNSVMFTLPYVGNSEWEIDNQTIIIPQESYGLDSRYKYKFTVMDVSGNQSEEWYGSANSDNPDPSSTTQLSYYYMYPVDNSQYNYCFKIDPAANNQPCNVNVNYSTTIPNYTNSITIK